jgi:GNAT superfamily N-acetyltransferase
MQQINGLYILDDTLSRIDFATVQAWLTTAYWCKGIAREPIERAARGSALAMGAYLEEKQVGYLRVISDKTTFGYFSDIFVDEAHRGRGLARAMVRFALEHPEFQGFRRWALTTKDAQSVYAALGFKALKDPVRWMERVPK